MQQRIRNACLVSIGVLLIVLGSAAIESHAAPSSGAPVGKLSARLEALANSDSLRFASIADQALTLGLSADGPGSLVRDAQGRILIEIRTGDTSPTFQQALRDHGADILHVSDRYAMIAAYVSTSQLKALESLSAVQNMQESISPMVGHAGTTPAVSTCPQGIAVSEGDVQVRANLARTNYSLNGSGVQVGVLSDSYNNLAGASTDVNSGDLPGVGNTCSGQGTPVNVLFDSGNTDEGRAMAQIVHDLAPNATLSFATANGGQATFADHIRALKTAGAHVIVDDVFYFAEPYFQDGIVTVGISDVVRTGALYFTSAGNSNVIDLGKNIASNEAPAYRPTACRALVTGQESCHDFNSGAGTQNSLDFNFQGGGNHIYFILQWAEPWYGVTTDLNLFVTFDGSSQVFSSTNINNGLAGTQQPFEFVSLTNNGADIITHVSVARKISTGGDSATPRLKVALLTNCDCGIDSMSPSTGINGDIVGPTLAGHSASHDAISVAAVPYNIDTTPERFSSRGPAAHYFGPVVNTIPAAAIPPDIIQQPDFTATDGGCTTFFVPPPSAGCDRFFGTSAAAPHAAAVAALLKQKATASNLRFNQGIARLVMGASARSMSGGNLNSVGAGLIDANAAVAKLLVLKSLFLPLIRR